MAQLLSPGRLSALRRVRGVAMVLPWAPSALPGLVFAADPGDTTTSPDDGSGHVTQFRHIYDSSKFMSAPDAASRPLLTTTGGATGTKRVLTLGPGRYLRSSVGGFSALTAAWGGAWATNSATIV